MYTDCGPDRLWFGGLRPIPELVQKVNTRLSAYNYLEHADNAVNMYLYLYLLVLVDVELWLPHSLSSLFLNALTDSAVTTDSGSLFQGTTTLWLKKFRRSSRRLLLVSSLYVDPYK